MQSPISYEEGQTVGTAIPVAVTDHALLEALAGRFECEKWEFIGRFIATALLRTVGGGRGGVWTTPMVKHLVETGLPVIILQINDIVTGYYGLMEEGADDAGASEESGRERVSGGR